MLACSCVLRWVPEIKEQEWGAVVSESNQASRVMGMHSTLRAAIVRIFTEIQGVQLGGEEKREKSVLWACEEKRRSQGCAQNDSFFISSLTIAFLIRRLTLHWKQSSAANCGLCKINSTAITNHSTHLWSPRHKAPLLGGYHISRRMTAGHAQP